jgi:hypothetical protein
VAPAQRRIILPWVMVVLQRLGFGQQVWRLHVGLLLVRMLLICLGHCMLLLLLLLLLVLLLVLMLLLLMVMKLLLLLLLCVRQLSEQDLLIGPLQTREVLRFYRQRWLQWRRCRQLCCLRLCYLMGRRVCSSDCLHVQ